MNSLKLVTPSCSVRYFMDFSAASSTPPMIWWKP